MLSTLVQLLSPEVSGQACMEHVAAISRHHRIQASPGYRAAAEECLRILGRGGVPAHIAAYPATGRTWEWSSLTPQEWDCRRAGLWLLAGDGASAGEPRDRLAWYDEEPISVIQRSVSASVTAPLAVVDDPESPDSWRGDLAGKIALVGGGDIHRIWAHARRAGAAGLVTDRMTPRPPVRPEGDLPDAREYTSFWWAPDEPRGWGFVITPRQGSRLRQAAKAGPVWLKAEIDARFYDGTIENVEAVIAGETADEVLVVSHLCHPRPSANDNAGGPAACMEAARALRRLIDSGRLPRPRRCIRFLFVPELTGTYAHLARRAGREQIAAALNVDMVGQDQAQTGSTLHCEYPPLACPSFAGDLLAAVVAEVAAREGGFRHDVTPFTGGSDHIILNDPAVGIPCPMLIQWPDRFYHTSADTPDRSDPAMLRRVSLMIAAYAYFAAAAGLREAEWLGGRMAAAFPGQLRQALEAARDPAAAAAFRMERKLADLGSLRRLLSPDEEKAFAPTLERLCDQVRRCLAPATVEPEGARREDPAGAVADGLTEGWAGPADLSVLRPGRRLPGPVRVKDQLGRLTEEERESWHAFAKAHPGTPTELLDYWADGRRTLAEICRLVELETGGCDRAFALGYFQLLARLDLLKEE